MREFELNLSGWKKLGPVYVELDGKPVEMKDCGSGIVTCKYQTEGTHVNVKVYRMLDVGGFVWFITQLFFFVITLFGLFGTHTFKKFVAVDFETSVELQQVNKLTLKFNSIRDGGRAAELQTDLRVLEISNAYYAEPKAKKMYTALTIVKVFLGIGLAVGGIVGLVFYIIAH